MARKFKLRFGDGTTLALDEEGLRTWISGGKVDDQTSIQPPGSKSWLPVREFLTKQRAASASGAPPSQSDAPLRFKPIDDSEPVQDDVYEDDGYAPPGPFSIVWLWAKRLVLTAVVLAGLGTAAAWWPVWVPKAKELSFVVFTLIHDRLNPPGASAATAEQERAREAREGFEAATEQLPHLQPETVRLVMQTGFGEVLSPAEVFRRAHEAAQRGVPSLPHDDGQELQDLKAAVMFVLAPPEKQRLRQYEQVRGTRVTLPFEDREAMMLTARGTRALSAEKRQRLQSLLARAVAAGLSPASTPAPDAQATTTQD